MRAASLLRNSANWLVARVLVCAFAVCTGAAWAQAVPVLLQAGVEEVSLDGLVGLLIDPTGQLTSEQVLAAQQAGQVDYPQGRLGLDVPDQAHWLVLQLNQEQAGGDWVLALPSAWLHDLRMVGPINANGKAIAPPILTGAVLPYANRPFQTERYALPIKLPQPGVYTVLVRVVSRTTMPFDLRLQEAGAFSATGLNKRIFDGLCYGAILAMLLYNLVLLSAFRDRTYALYVVSSVFSLLTLASFNGHTAHYLFPWLTGQGQQGNIVFPALWLATGAWFAHGFLDLPRYAKRLGRVALALAVACTVPIVLALFGAMQWGQTVLQWLSMTMMLLVYAGAVVALRAGYAPARWYLLGQSTIFVFVFLIIFMQWGWVVWPFMDDNALQTGVAIEVMVFAVALSSRIRLMQAQHAEMKTRTQRLTVAAESDPLTGISNRAGLAAQAHMLLSQPGNYCLILLDLDKFKPINDQYGHEAGDVVLVEVARRLAAQLRAGDTVARVGGDEFVILLAQSSDRTGLELISKRLLEVIKQPVAYGQMQLSVGGSLGLARYPGNGLTLADLMQAADVAMYHIKKHGRDGFSFFDDLSDLDAQAAAQSVAGAAATEDSVELF